MARPQVRDDVALDGRLPLAPGRRARCGSTPTRRPSAPPAAFVDALAGAIDGIAWNRYPDRGATALRARIAEVEGPEVPAGITAPNVFAANGSNEVLQTRLPRLRRRRAARC